VTTASDLLERHLQTLVRDPEQWQTLIADDIVWELAYAPAIGHPARLTMAKARWPKSRARSGSPVAHKRIVMNMDTSRR
jgi:hypothetical protein